MNPEQQKERALSFLKNFEKPDAKAFVAGLKKAGRYQADVY